MISFKILNSTIIPYLGLFFISSLFFLILYKFLILKFPFFSLKVISGAFDWKGSKGKITPGRAFFSGIMGSFFPGTFLGFSLALSLSGPGIVVLIFLIHTLQTSIEYVLSTSSFLFRKRREDGTLDTGILSGLDKYSRVKWFGVFYGFILILISLLSSLWNLSFLNTIHYANIENSRIIPFEPSSLIVFFIIFLILIYNGEIRRIALFSKIVMYAFIIFMFLSFTLNPIDLNSYSLVFQEFPRLFKKEKIIFTVYSLYFYMVLSEVPNIRFNLFAGYIRTDFSAKAGIASLLAPLIQFIFVLLCYGLLYRFFLENQLFIKDPNNIFELLIQFQLKYLPLFFIQYSDSEILQFLLISICLLLLFSSFLSWFFTGNIISRQLSLRFNIPNFYPTLSILLFIVLGSFMNSFLNDYKFYVLYFFGLSLILTFTIIFSLLYHQLAKYELNKYFDSYHGGIDLSRDIFILLFTLIPSNLISKIFGLLSLIQFPKMIMIFIIKIFSKIYKINLNEVKKDISEFKNLNEFFIRELKEGVRPIEKNKKVIVSPVDALLNRRGTIQKKMLIQAKGIHYSLKDLLGDPDYIPYFENGKYCVLYLSPQDYHRIHTPFDCEVEGYTYSPGSLFPVNEPAVEGVYGLFPKNERLTTFLKTRYGRIAMVKVGATNVGKIRVMYDSIQTNQWIRRKKIIKYNHKILFQKGMEIARFEMGSTVILIFENHKVEFLEEAPEGIKVKYGQGIAKFK